MCNILQDLQGFFFNSITMLWYTELVQIAIIGFKSIFKGHHYLHSHVKLNVIHRLLKACLH